MISQTFSEGFAGHGLILLTEITEIFQGNAGIFQALPNDFPWVQFSEGLAGHVRTLLAETTETLQGNAGTFKAIPNDFPNIL